MATTSSSEEVLYDDDMLLYGDLSDTKPAAVSKPALSSLSKKRKSVDLEEESDVIGDEAMQALQKQVEDLAEENRRLRRNIGTLYRTAKAEIKRKDDEIARLVNELEEVKKIKC